MDRSHPVRVSAEVPLLHRGLQRAVRRSGLALAGPGQDAAATATLRVEGTGRTDETLDIAVGPDTVTITLRATPSVDTWTSIHPLVAALFDTDDGSSA